MYANMNHGLGFLNFRHCGLMGSWQPCADTKGGDLTRGDGIILERAPHSHDKAAQSLPSVKS